MGLLEERMSSHRNPGLLLVASTLLCACGGNDSSPGSAQPVGVRVSPASAFLVAGGTAAFTAAVSGTTITGVTWSVEEGPGGGSVTSAGLYTAPTSTGTYHVVATSDADPSKSGMATVTATAAAPPAAPTNLTVTAMSSSSLNLSWSDPGGHATGFYIERAPDSAGSPGTFVQIASVSASATSFPDTGLSPGTKYWYRLRAYGPGGDSAYTNSVSATTAVAGGTLAITTTGCPDATQSQAYAGCAIAASGGTSPYTFSVVSSSSYAPLPEGMTLNASTGQVSSELVGGQGTYVVQFQVKDSAGNTATAAVSFAVAGSNAFLASIFPSSTTGTGANISIFHHRVDVATTGLPVDSSPAAPIYSGYQSSSLRVFFGNAAYSNLPNGIPAIEVPYNQPAVPVKTTQYQSYYTSGPVPPYAPIEGTLVSEAAGGDGHVLVYVEGGGSTQPALYEMWQGSPVNNGASWTDSSNALWTNVSTNALTPQGNGTSDAAGLPVAPLLVNADEVIGTGTPAAPNGTVRHPIRFTLTHMLNNWVWPATETAGVGSCTGVSTGTMLSQSSPPTACSMSGPAGEIYRLKATVSTPSCAATSPQAAIIMTALRNYGIILADNGLSGGLIGTPDTRWNDNDLSCLTQLTLSNFEPVNVSSLMVNPNSGATSQ